MSAKITHLIGWRAGGGQWDQTSLKKTLKYFPIMRFPQIELTSFLLHHSYEPEVSHKPSHEGDGQVNFQLYAAARSSASFAGTES